VNAILYFTCSNNARLKLTLLLVLWILVLYLHFKIAIAFLVKIAIAFLVSKVTRIEIMVIALKLWVLYSMLPCIKVTIFSNDGC
jgi:energy-coupling factor transporter transmembrane protein EcfT